VASCCFIVYNYPVPPPDLLDYVVRVLYWYLNLYFKQDVKHRIVLLLDQIPLSFCVDASATKRLSLMYCVIEDPWVGLKQFSNETATDNFPPSAQQCLPEKGSAAIGDNIRLLTYLQKAMTLLFSLKNKLRLHSRLHCYHALQTIPSSPQTMNSLFGKSSFLSHADAI